MSEELRTEQQQSLSLQRIKKTLEIQVHELAVPTNIFLIDRSFSMFNLTKRS